MTTPNPPRTAETVAGDIRSIADAPIAMKGSERSAIREAADHLDRLSREVAELRDDDQDVLEALADAWPEARADVLAGDPCDLIEKLIAERDAEIVEAETYRSRAAYLQVQVEALSGVLGEARMVVDRIADCPPDDRARVRRVVEDARLVRHKLALPAPAKGGE